MLFFLDKMIKMLSSAESQSPEKLAQQMLKYVQHPHLVTPNKFFDVVKIAQYNDAVCEQVRIQSNQFTLIYPLFAGAQHRVFRMNCLHCEMVRQSEALLTLLQGCTHSSVSANLLAKEKRVWRFLISLWENDLRVLKGPDPDSPKRCDVRLFTIITRLTPWVNQHAWKFAVEQCGLLEHLLQGMKEKPRTCHAHLNLSLIIVVLARKQSQSSIDTLAHGGLFMLLEKMIQKSSNLIQGTPPCPKCNCIHTEEYNVFSRHFLQVKKKPI